MDVKASLRKGTLLSLGLAALVALGTVGYIFLEDMTLVDALYTTVVVLSTVGLGAWKPMGEAGKLFTILLKLDPASTGYR